MRKWVIIGILVWQANLFAQGSLVYRNGAEIMSGGDIDMNQDGVVEFRFGHPLVSIGNGNIRLNQLSPQLNADPSPSYAGEIMLNSSSPREIEWSSGMPILPDPGPSAEWSSVQIGIQHMLVAIRLRNGDDWNYGWVRFEKVGEDAIGEFWGLRDAAYNSVPNAPINMLQVPEPSTMTLLIVGGLGLVLAAGRSGFVSNR